MNLTLEELRSDLILRWKAAFDRIAEAKAEPRDAAETVYTQYPAYALSGYSTKKFKPGARVSRSPSADGDDYEFRLDAQGRPVHVRFSHRVNRVSWRGVYRYGEDEVEQIEFCMQTGTPSLYNRLILSGPCVLAEQRFVCNSGGSDKRYKDPQQLLADPHAYFIYITRYQVEDGLTKSAQEYQEVSGEIHRPTLEYAYAAGKLERITQHWPGGETRTVFAAKSKTSLKSLSDALSNKIAAAVLTRLRDAAFDAPLVALELSFREGDSHIPMLIPLTERDAVKSLALPAEIPAERWLKLDPEHFAPEIADFDARAAASSSPSTVSKMLRNAARLVTAGAPESVPVAEGFVAYAIDWELEADEVPKILKQCGATPALIRKWKKRGWL
ncbi:MAG TPA: hypothetical protein PKD61_08965 [Polyangiaceae bacterium]|nr:hypothetical protein [Polyangiaceae bacterium]